MIDWRLILDVHVTDRRTQERATYTIAVDLRALVLATTIGIYLVLRGLA